MSIDAFTWFACGPKCRSQSKWPAKFFQLRATFRSDAHMARNLTSSAGHFFFRALHGPQSHFNCGPLPLQSTAWPAISFQLRATPSSERHMARRFIAISGQIVEYRRYGPQKLAARTQLPETRPQPTARSPPHEAHRCPQYIFTEKTRKSCAKFPILH